MHNTVHNYPERSHLDVCVLSAPLAPIHTVAFLPYAETTMPAQGFQNMKGANTTEAATNTCIYML